MENKILKALQEDIRIDMCGLQVEKNFLDKIKNRPTEMLWGGRWEGGSCLGTHVRIKDFKIKKIKKI